MLDTLSSASSVQCFIVFLSVMSNAILETNDRQITGPTWANQDWMLSCGTGLILEWLSLSALHLVAKFFSGHILGSDANGDLCNVFLTRI